ncbi:hypothetical protein Tco_1440475 [Tanacetum coccineum]
MRTRSQARKRRQQQVRQTSVESPNLEKPNNNQETFNPPIVTMDDNRTMAQLLEAPTEGYEDAIVVPEITANNFEIKHGLLNLVQNKQFFGHDKEDPHAHIRYFNKITSTMSSRTSRILWSLITLRSRAPLILGRPFLRTARALIDVHGEQMTLRHDDQSVTFKVGDTKTLSYNIIESVNRVDVIDIACEEYVQEVLEILKWQYQLLLGSYDRLSALHLSLLRRSDF